MSKSSNNQKYEQLKLWLKGIKNKSLDASIALNLCSKQVTYIKDENGIRKPIVTYIPNDSADRK